MHPIWGPRCIGVQESDLTYWELHIVTTINMACIDFGGLFSVRGEEGHHGFQFDPSLWFIKAVLQKYSKNFAHSRPVWASASADTYAQAHKTEIENEFQNRWGNGAEFVAAVLSSDTDANLLSRQKGLFALMLRNCFAHPANAARAVVRWLYRKGKVYICPTVPVIGIDTTMASTALRACLAEKLGRVFPNIVVADQPVPWRVRKRLQATQSLLVFRYNGRQISQRKIDKCISISNLNREEVEVGVAAILDCVVQYNERWSAFYGARSL